MLGLSCTTKTPYPDPFLFNPDSFIKDGKLNPTAVGPVHTVFGCGRRICPGRRMALSAVWIAVASIIATFDLSKAVDDDGEIIEPSRECTSSLGCIPLPFKCSIKPRSMRWLIEKLQPQCVQDRCNANTVICLLADLNHPCRVSYTLHYYFLENVVFYLCVI